MKYLYVSSRLNKIQKVLLLVEESCQSNVPRGHQHPQLQWRPR